MAAAVMPAAPSVTDQILDPSAAPRYDFAFNDFLKREYHVDLQTRRPVCKLFLQGHCPAGDQCPDKHPRQSNYNNLICKHWLRGLCKKGNTCEFLHEYNLRGMPECTHYARTMTCQNGSDCLYLHLDPASKRPPCAHFDRGFCPLGPRCADKHVKRATFCTFYLAGFCPNGRDCTLGAHPVWRETTELEKPKVKVVLSAEEQEQERERLLADLERERGDDARDFQDRSFNPQKQGRGRGGGGGGGGRRFAGRPRKDRY